jgi:hypothetical protein
MEGAENWIRARGLDFSSQRFAGMYRLEARSQYVQKPIAQAVASMTIPKGELVERDFLKPRKYMYNVGIDATDRTTGVSSVVERSFYSDRQLTIQQIADVSDSLYEWKSEDYDLINNGVQWVSADHNAGWSY